MSVLGVDLGTSGCKAAAFSADGRRLAHAQRDYATLHPQPGWAELDSHAVVDLVREVIRQVAAQTHGDPVTALCVSSFGEAFVPVTRQREILGPSILCMDTRGLEHAAALERDFGHERFYRINPNTIGPQYSMPKLLWLREHQPELFARADYFLLWSDLIGFMLGCEPVTSNSLANRTLLFDLRRNDWSEELLGWAGLERRHFGRVMNGGEVVGEIPAERAADWGLPPGVLFVSGGHDQCCNALGSGCIEAGQAVCGIGTFECLTPCYAHLPEPGPMLAGGLNIEHHVLPGLYVSFLFNQAGCLVKWFRDTFAGDRAGDADLYDALNRELPVEPTRLLTLPHFTPPLWPRTITDTAGMIMGLKTSTTRGEILKSIMESATYYFADSLDALKAMGVRNDCFIATGGGAKSDAWLQIKADIFGVPFNRPAFAEGSLMGAAMLAGLATEVWGSAKEATDLFVRTERVFEPDPSRHAIYQERLALFRQVYPANRAILSALV